jgi:hypothetical protein
MPDLAGTDLRGTRSASDPFAVRRSGLAPAQRIDVDVTDPVKALEVHAEALSAKDYRAYIALLSPDFRYYPRPGDLSCIPWLTQDYWTFADEADIVANMMADPSLDFELVMQISNSTPAQSGEVLAVDADARVLVRPDSGWFQDTRFEYTFAPDSRGFFRIVEIREVRSTEPGRRTMGLQSANGGIPGSSWTCTKASYRSDSHGVAFTR